MSLMCHKAHSAWTAHSVWMLALAQHPSRVAGSSRSSNVGGQQAASTQVPGIAGCMGDQRGWNWVGRGRAGVGPEATSTTGFYPLCCTIRPYVYGPTQRSLHLHGQTGQFRCKETHWWISALTLRQGMNFSFFQDAFGGCLAAARCSCSCFATAALVVPRQLWIGQLTLT